MTTRQTAHEAPARATSERSHGVFRFLEPRSGGVSRRIETGRWALAPVWPVDWVHDAAPMGVALVAYLLFWDLFEHVAVPVGLVYLVVVLVLLVSASFVGAVPSAYLGGMAVCFYSAYTEGSRMVLDVPGRGAAYAGLLLAIVLSRVVRGVVQSRSTEPV